MLTASISKEIKLDANNSIRIYATYTDNGVMQIKDIMEYEATNENLKEAYNTAMRMAYDPKFKNCKITICPDLKPTDDEKSILIKKEGE